MAAAPSARVIALAFHMVTFLLVVRVIVVGAQLSASRGRMKTALRRRVGAAKWLKRAANGHPPPSRRRAPRDACALRAHAPQYEALCDLPERPTNADLILRSPRSGRLEGWQRRCASGTRSCLLRLEIHRDAVDAVAQVGRRRAVVEDVAEVAAAAAAMHLGADHAVAAVGRRFHGAFDGVVEARPAGAAVEFLLADEQRLAAADAGEGAGTLFVIEGAAAGRLGAVLAHHPVLLRREQASPFGIAVGDGIALRFHGGPRSVGGWVSFHSTHPSAVPAM